MTTLPRLTLGAGRSVRDGTPNGYSAYGLTGVPETYFVDARGRVVAHAVGALSRRELEASTAALLAGPAP
ncbi:hypothetical protein Gocc_2576 [Gaiella occulta]|uniref:Redoxin n=1 Tax=Gaiella occulta TaxID=1002870 RepID=A0A7M2YUA4_9ACTN|nr:hypothetical protein [Gaiella occulta]RDI73663.1 hypothetical protein Gocc_2576 [Gaiella occulta]